MDILWLALIGALFVSTTRLAAGCEGLFPGR